MATSCPFTLVHQREQLDPRRVSEGDQLTKSAGGKQDAFVAFLPNSFHTGEKERGKKTEAEPLLDKKKLIQPGRAGWEVCAVVVPLVFSVMECFGGKARSCHGFPAFGNSCDGDLAISG